MNRLLKYFTIAALLICSQGAWAQQEPQYTQYMFNTMSVNPAYAGTRNALNMLLLSRIQWVGIDGAPSSQTFALHTPLNNRRVGVGFSVISDDIGPVNNTYINFNYAYRLKLTEAMTLSLGIKGGIYNYHAKISDLVEGDVSFADNYNATLQPNAGAGAYLYTDNYYLGISVPKLLQTDIGDSPSSTGGVVSKLKRHYFVIAGYVYRVNPNLLLKPSVLSKFVQGAPPSADITAQALFKDTYWLGVTYRLGDAVAFLADLKLNRQLTIGYSYDITTSDLSGYNSGSHEIMISYDFDGFLKNKVKSPRFF